MIFIVSGTICDEKKIILAAALPGVFLNDQKSAYFDAIFSEPTV